MAEVFPTPVADPRAECALGSLRGEKWYDSERISIQT